MKILFCGGGSGGHFYPSIAIAEALNTRSRAEQILRPELYYMAPSPYDEQALFANNITYVYNGAGKLRRYFSLLNVIDAFKTVWAIFTALFRVYKIYPDVVVGKGAYASFPVLVAAKILNIPVIIHESDNKPGRVNAWAGRFAYRVAVSYPEAVNFFRTGHAAHTGQPIRKALQELPTKEVSAQFFQMDATLPTILVVGGSQGAGKINETILETITNIVKDYQIIHQTGVNNFTEVSTTAKFLLGNSEHKNRYRAVASLNSDELRHAAGLADIIISRAGSMIFEVALWGKPSIIIPIPESISHDQTANAYSYARSGAATVVEQNNLSGSIILAEIHRVLGNPEVYNQMVANAQSFAKKDAAEIIAEEILKIGLEHEK